MVKLNKKNKVIAFVERWKKEKSLLTIVSRNAYKNRRKRIKTRNRSFFKTYKFFFRFRFPKKHSRSKNKALKKQSFKKKKGFSKKKSLKKNKFAFNSGFIKKKFHPFIFNYKLSLLFFNKFLSKTPSLAYITLCSKTFNSISYVQYKSFKNLLTSISKTKKINVFLPFFIKLYLSFIKKTPGSYSLWTWLGPRATAPLLFNKKKIKRYFNDFYNYSLKLDYFYFLKYICIFKAKISRSRILCERNKLNYFNVKDNRVFTNIPSKKGFLYVTFARRNTFFNLADHKSRTLYLTTVRREGFLGRRRSAYTSIFSTSRIVKQKIKLLKLSSIAVVYKGWSRFRVAIKKSLRYRDRFKVPISYIRYVIKIPHNGCRPRKTKRKKRKRKLFLKRRFKKKFFFSKISKTNYGKKGTGKRKFKKWKSKKNKNVHY